MSTHLGLFAKYWQPGAVKTRLAKGIGAERASSLYRNFLATTLSRFREIGDARSVVVWPPDRLDDFADLAGEHWSLTEQCSGDLGDRMRAHFQAVLPSASSGAVLIGTDSPTLPIEFVAMAFEFLAAKEQVVLGPSDDGGYYLIGIRGNIPNLFGNIAWSTDEVFGQTVAVLESAGVPYAILPKWYDVDDVTDLRRLAEELNAKSLVDVRLNELRSSISSVLEG